MIERMNDMGQADVSGGEKLKTPRDGVRGETRRGFLQAGALCLALPWLESRGFGAELLGVGKEASSAPKRLLLIGRPLGTHADYFFPQDTGPGYTASRYLKLLEKHRGRFTVMSGMSHVGYPNVHHTEAGLFTGVAPERIQRIDDIRNSVSLDQLVAEQVGRQTRHPSLLLGRTSILPMVYSKSGVALPTEDRLDRVFERLFMEGTREEVAREVARLAEGRSILDQLGGQLKSLVREVSAGDRDRLEQFTTSVRAAEQGLQQSEVWASRPKPRVDRKVEDYRDHNWSTGQKLRYDLAFLAFQTELTRVAVCVEAPGDAGEAPGTVLEHHDASHHGRDPKKIEQLALFEEEETRNLAGLMDKLASVKEGDQTLLDRTIVFWGSNLGNPSAHSSSNLPILVAGGGFKHQGHVRFDPERNEPLSNLYVRMLQQMEVPVERFGSSTGVVGAI